MADTEKITINLGVVDLGRIDLLVEQGFYTTRTDFIRAAIRNQLDKHETDIQVSIERKSFVIGVLIYGADDLEKKHAKGEKVSLHVVGTLILTNDITPELADATISSVKVFGVFKASDEVKAVLADRIVL